MSASTIEFASAFTTDLIDAASVSFVRGYLFRRYGRWLIAACLINAVGFGLVLWLGGNDGLVLSFIALIVVMGPAYLALFYFFYPRRIADRMKQRLMPRAHFSFNESMFGFTNDVGTGAMAWSGVKAVVDHPTYFLLVFSPIAFSVIPKAGMPVDALRLLEAKRTA